MSFGRPASRGEGSNDGRPQHALGAAQYVPRPGSARPACRSSGRFDSPREPDSSARCQMTVDEFKRQVQDQFAVVLSWHEVRALQKLYGEPDSGTVDFNKFKVALGKLPVHGSEKAARANSFLPKHAVECDLDAIEKKIIQKLEGTCEVAGNYQYQWARRMLCDSASTMAGGLDKEQLRQRLSGLMGVELSNGEAGALFQKYADPAKGRVDMQSFATRLLAPDRDNNDKNDNNGWFTLDNQMHEPVFTNRVSPCGRYHKRHGVETYDPLDNVFPHSLKGFKWDVGKLENKLKVKMREHTGGIGRYQFSAGCNLFRHKEVNRKGDRIAPEEFIRIVEYKFGMKLDLDEVLALFDSLVPGTGESIEIAEMVRVLVPDDYTDESWFSKNESTDMYGYTKATPEKMVLHAKNVNSWNLTSIEDKIREKIHERVGGAGAFKVQAAYSLFLDGHNTGLTKKSFKAQMHDKFAIVLSDKDVDDVFAKYDKNGKGCLDVHSFAVSLVNPLADPEPWFRDRASYDFHVSNRAPPKKDPMKAECWKRTKWTFRQFEASLRDKILAKSSQDGGNFAYKSAVSMLRSANPDHLDSSNLDREAFKFVIFRRFDLVMDDFLLDEVFARFDPAGSGKIPVHTLVQYLLPSNNSGSHHLVPKTKEQGEATNTLLGKIFDATGRKREVINLNGLCVEHPQEYPQVTRPQERPQARGCAETMAAGDRRDDEENKASPALQANLPVASKAASAEIMTLEAARDCPNTQAAMAAVAARCRGESPLALNGDFSYAAEAPYEAARPETSRTNSSGGSEAGYVGRGVGCAGRGKDGGGGGDTQRALMADSGTRVRDGDSIAVADPRYALRQGSIITLRERERLLDERERSVREREAAINDCFPASADDVTAATGCAGVGRSTRDDATYFQSGVNHPHPPGSGRNGAASTTVMPRQQGGGTTHHQQQSPKSPASRTGGNNNNNNNGNNNRPQSHRRQMSPRHRAEDEATLIAKCRALNSARRTAAEAQRRESTPNTPHRQLKQADYSQPRADLPHHSATNQNDAEPSATNEHDARPPTVPLQCSSAENRRRLESARDNGRTGGYNDRAGEHNGHASKGEQFGSDPRTGLPYDADGKVLEIRAVGAVFGRAPSRPPTAVAAQRQEIRPQSRPLSAVTSRINGDKRCATRGGRLIRSARRGAGNNTVTPGLGSVGLERFSGWGSAQGSSSCRTSASVAVSARVGRCRKRLDGAYAMQMRAMQRLHRRGSKS